MFAQILTSLLLVHGLFATQLKPGQYHVVNLAHPYAPVSVDAAHSRVYVPPAFSGGHSLWDVLTPPGALDGITMHSVDAGRWAQVTPGQGQYIGTTANRSSTFALVLSGTADFPGDGGMIPDSHIDYWTIGAPDGSVWTYNPDAGSEVLLLPPTADNSASQFWMFAAPGAIPFLPRDLSETRELGFFSPAVDFDANSDSL